MPIDIDEWCSNCDTENRFTIDEMVLEAVLQGWDLKTFRLPTCKECGAELLPCAWCYTDETDCSKCPFEKYKTK